MDQFDLFDLETTHTENTRTTEVVTPSVQTTYDDDSLWAYAIRNQQLIWSSKTHRKRSLEQLDKFIKLDPAFQSMSLVDFGTDHFDVFANHLIAQGKSHATINRYSATLSRVFNYAYKKRKYPYPVKFEFFSEKNRNRVRVYSDQEMDNIKDWFLAEGQEWLWKMCVVASKAGLRRMEIVSLCRPVEGVMSRLSDDKMWIHIHPTVEKTGRGRRVAIKNPEILEAIEYLKVALKLKWSDKTFYKWWGKMRRDLFHNDPEAVFHSMRHTCASNMANKLKLNQKLIGETLGHSCFSTTSKYVHADDEALLAASAQM